LVLSAPLRGGTYDGLLGRVVEPIRRRGIPPAGTVLRGRRVPARVVAPSHQRKRDVRIARGPRTVLPCPPRGAPPSAGADGRRQQRHGGHVQQGMFAQPSHPQDARQALRAASGARVLTISLRWVPSEANQAADAITRPPMHEGLRLLPATFRWLEKVFGAFTVDLMASSENAQHSPSPTKGEQRRLSFFSRYNWEGSAGVDVFRQNVALTPGLGTPAFGYCYTSCTTWPTAAPMQQLSCPICTSTGPYE